MIYVFIIFVNDDGNSKHSVYSIKNITTVFS